jgi:hypothetical protein
LDGWERIAERVREGGEVDTVSRPHVRRLVVIIAAFALFALAVIPLWLVLRADTSTPGGRGSSAPSPVRHPVGGSGGTPPPSIPQQAGPCRGDQLHARDIVTHGAAGNVWTPVVLVNRSATACRLSGYPSIRFLGRAGNDLHLRAAHAPDNTAAVPPSPIPRAPFILAPNQKAWVILYFSDVQPPCARVFGLAMTPPGGTGTVTMLVNPIHEWDVCEGALTVTAATPTRPG